MRTRHPERSRGISLSIQQIPRLASLARDDVYA